MKESNQEADAVLLFKEWKDVLTESYGGILGQLCVKMKYLVFEDLFKAKVHLLKECWFSCQILSHPSIDMA